MVITPLLYFLFIGTVLAVWELLWFHINFKFFIYSCKKWVKDFNLDSIEFGKAVIFTILILPINNHGLSFNFLVYFSFSSEICIT